MKVNKRLERSYEAYVRFYKKSEEKYEMRERLLSIKDYEKAYVMHRGIPNIARTIAKKSQMISYKQALAISRAQTELEGKKVTWKQVALKVSSITSEQWKSIQLTLQAWS